MRNAKKRWLGFILAFLCGLLPVLAATKTEQGSSLALAISFSNAPTIFAVTNLPSGTTAFNVTNDTSFVLSLVDTDGSGKIDGAAFVRLAISSTAINVDTNGITNVTTTITAFTDTMGDISGKISSGKAGAVTITERYKGNGYSAAGTTNEVSFPVFSATAGAASVTVNFKSTKPPVQDTNTGQFVAAGNLSGSIKPGSSLINGGKSINVKEAATLPLAATTLDLLDLQIVQLGDKFQTSTLFEGEALNGSGSVSGKKAKATLKGHGNGRGESLQLSSAAAPFTSGNTNSLPGTSGTVTTFSNPVTMKGRLNGQAVSASSSSIEDGFFGTFPQ